MTNQHDRRKLGFIHLFFMAAVVVLFMVFITLTSEAMEQKILRKEMEVLLKLDYATEACYLLHREGEMMAPEGVSYYNIDGEALKSNEQAHAYIRIERNLDEIFITSWFKGEKKGEYMIEENKRLHDG